MNSSQLKSHGSPCSDTRRRFLKTTAVGAAAVVSAPHLARAAKANEKIVMGIILSLITVVAGMNIVGTLILVVLTRTREISILRAMGASAGQIRLVFMLEGLIVGLVGPSWARYWGCWAAWACDSTNSPWTPTCTTSTRCRWSSSR